MSAHEPPIEDPAYQEALVVLERLAAAATNGERNLAEAPSIGRLDPEQASPSTSQLGTPPLAGMPIWSETTLRHLLESLPDALVVIAADGTIVLVNEQAERMFGYERKELLGRPIEILVPERFHPDHVGHRQRYFAAPRRRPMGSGMDLFGRRKDGSTFPVEISLSPLQTEHGLLATSSIRDISTRKREEAKYRTLLENRWCPFSIACPWQVL